MDNLKLTESGTYLIVMTPEQVNNLAEQVAKACVRENEESMRKIVKSLKPQKLLSSKETAALLHVTTKCLLDWKKNGRLIPLEIGGRNRYREDVILSMINRKNE